MTDIEAVKKRHQAIIQQLSDPELISDWEKFEELSKEKLRLDKVIDKYQGLEEIKRRVQENQLLIASKEDQELVSLAEGELSQLRERQRAIENEISALETTELLLNEENFQEDNRQRQETYSDVIIEIRAGTGGEEAALFASDLYRMYSRYAELAGFKSQILDSKPTDIGGIKEITFEIAGENVFSKMKNEGGVHRVQRIPSTEKSGRIHTSTATVAVLPKPKKSEIKIRSDELKIDFYRASGPGGQYVNKRETAVRITHLPSGIVVTSQTERNQLKNKEGAMSILEVRLLEKKRSEEARSFSGKRNTQIGGAKRAEKIRTYNFPQDRVTDHRIKKSWHNLEKIIDGDLNQIISALQKTDAERAI